jgi:beta-galactosidase
MPAPWVRGFLVLACAVSLCSPAFTQAAPGTGHRFGIEGNHFVLDGNPFQIISGEMHYARIPREYWRDRLKKARAMGLNTISTYVFWNAHEPQPGIYDFSGMRDAAAYIRMAQEEGLYVILRPGPYSCAEWDLGGFPSWLLGAPAMVLRSSDEKFMGPAERWLERLGQELAPLQLARGGPILAVQVENEYGSFGGDQTYMRRIRDALLHAGFTDSLLFTADGGDELRNGTLPDVHAAVNFGPGEARGEISKLERFRPETPVLNSEYWDGWFDHWGDHHHSTDASRQAQEIDWMLGQGYSINLYMFDGGTSFGFSSGANWDHKTYEPDVTSYDYDSPVSESGALTKKYFQFREVIRKHRPGVAIPDPPAPLPVVAVPEFELGESASLWANLPDPVTARRARTMESFGQSYGYILYRTKIVKPVIGDLAVQQLRSYARIFVNGRPVGTLDRRKHEDHLPIEATAQATLDVLVEGTGRINFSTQLRGERQGIGGPITLAGRELRGWQVFPLPMADLVSLKFHQSVESAPIAPAFYRGHFDLDEAGDTFLDTRGWGKGAVWINGHALGRFWNVGPQQTLYVPAPWLKRGANEIVVFTLVPPKDARLHSLREPVLDESSGQ